MNTAQHIDQAITRAHEIHQELVTAGAKRARLDLATKVCNDLEDIRTAGCDTEEILENLTQYLAGGRAALEMLELPADTLWDELEASLAHLVAHVEFVRMYGE